MGFDQVTMLWYVSVMPKRFHTPLIILAGLCAAQIIGTLQVYWSNAQLHQTVTTVKDAGYLAVPNDLIGPLLDTTKTALLSGIFFTLSIGAGVTILALASVWVWKYVCLRKRYLAIPFLLPWLVFLAGINMRGVSFLSSLYFTAVPALVSMLALKFTPDHLSRNGWVRGSLHVTVITLLAFLWATQISSSMFINIRDSLLLSNPVGIKINDFYYRYTLYPAEVFKSLNQKMIKTCHIADFENRALQKKLVRDLADRNYLVVENVDGADLSLVEKDGALLLKNRGGVIIKTSLKKIAARPGPILKSFSRKSDRYLFFRQFTFLSLLVAFPVVLYFFVHALFYRIATFFLKPTGASVLAGLFCLLIGALLVLPVYVGIEKEISPDRIPELLRSKKWQDNVSALKTIAKQKQPWQFNTDYPDLVSSPHIPVRYWLARSLAHSTDSQAYAALAKLMDDPQPNVACQALYGLGRRGDRQTVKLILDKINYSDHWYVQWYGYNALRALGWRQKISI